MRFTRHKVEQPLQDTEIQGKKRRERGKTYLVKKPKDKDLSQRKTFCRERITKFNCARKKTVVMDILIKLRNGDR